MRVGASAGSVTQRGSEGGGKQDHHGNVRSDFRPVNETEGLRRCRGARHEHVGGVEVTVAECEGHRRVVALSDDVGERRLGDGSIDDGHELRGQ